MTILEHAVGQTLQCFETMMTWTEKLTRSVKSFPPLRWQKSGTFALTNGVLKPELSGDNSACSAYDLRNDGSIAGLSETFTSSEPRLSGRVDSN